METEIYDRNKHCGFSNPIWLDILNEEEINDVDGYKPELEVLNGI